MGQHMHTGGTYVADIARKRHPRTLEANGSTPVPCKLLGCATAFNEHQEMVVQVIVGRQTQVCYSVQ